MNLGKSLKPVYLAAAGLTLWAAVACNTGASPTAAPPTNAPTLEQTVTTTPPASTPTSVPTLPATPTYTPPPPTPTATTPHPTPTPPPPPTPTPRPAPSPIPSTPTPPPSPTPAQNPAVAYALQKGLPAQVAAYFGIPFGADNVLDDNEKLRIEFVAAKSGGNLELQVALASSPYIIGTKKNVPISQLESAASVLQAYTSKTQAAVWAQPDKDVQLSTGNYNLSSLLTLISTRDSAAISTLDAVDSRVSKYLALLQAFPQVNAAAVISMALKYDPFNYDEFDLDKIMDALGMPGQNPYANGRVWDLSKADGPDGQNAYNALVLSQDTRNREANKASAHFAKVDSKGGLVRPFLSNNADQIKMLLQLNPPNPFYDNSTVANQSGAVSFMHATKMPDGTLRSSYTIAFGLVGGIKDERQAVINITQWYLNTMVHNTVFAGETRYDTSKRDFGKVFPQNTVFPPDWTLGADPFVKYTTSGFNVTSMTAKFNAVGIPAFGVEFVNVPGLPVNLNTGKVIVNGTAWWWEGNMIFNAPARGITPCLVFATREQIANVNLKTGYAGGDGSFCK